MGDMDRKIDEMAEEVANKQKSRSIDSTLDWSLEVWRGLPEIAEEIHEWETFERLNYLYEWSIEEDRISELREYASEGVLESRQAERLRELERLVEQNRPILEGLLTRYIG